MRRVLLVLAGCLLSLHCTKGGDAPAEAATGDEIGVRAFTFRHETLPAEVDGELDRAIEDHAALMWMDPEGALPWRHNQTGYSVRVVHVRALDAERKPPAYSIGIAVILTRPVPGDVDETHRVTALREVEGQSGLRAAALAALGETYAGAVAHVEAASASDAQILDWLSSAEPPRLLPALDQVRERRLGGAAASLRPLLVQDGPHVREALGVAMALADPALLSEIARLTGSQSMDVVRAAIHAIAAIGTPRARQYLESIAVGHAWEEGRVLARSLVR